jgi:cytosine deaminase
VSWLRSARIASGELAGVELVDVELAGGVIAQVIPATGTRLPGDEDLSGQVLMPSFAEPHAHLDKALTASRAPNPAGDLLGAIRAMQGIADSLTYEDIVARAERALRVQLALGTTSIRTHVNAGGPMGMRAVAALIEVRERWRGVVDVQVVALVSHPMAGQAGKDLRQALAEGADVAGGCPHLDPDPDGAVGICLDAAGEAGVPMDLHTDETLNPRMLTLATMADLVARTGFPHQVTASHCVSLGVQDARTQQRISEAVAAARIAVVALPQTNLYLQGRDQPAATPRGLTAVAALRAAGATVAAGGDNLRDPFHPVGRGDALEVAALMVTSGHLDPAAALESVTVAPRAALGLPAVRIVAGSPADLVAMPASDALEALGAAIAQRTVWRAGRVVARTTVRTDLSTSRQMEGAA